MNSLNIRFAEEKDLSLIYQFIKELADYEKLLHEVVADEQKLKKTLFDQKYAEVLIAEEDDQAVGFALFFHNYSTFLGQPGIYLEDLYVKKAFRGRGYGKALLRKLAQLAIERECGRLDWSVLDWNVPAIDFYKSLGAVSMEEWLGFRLTGKALENFAG